MEIQELQKKIDAWIKANTTGYWSPLSMMARLTEETGEVARILNHAYGEKKKKPEEIHNSLEEEIADVFYTIVCMANAFNINLDKAIQKVFNKVDSRDKERFKE